MSIVETGNGANVYVDRNNRAMEKVLTIALWCRGECSTYWGLVRQIGCLIGLALVLVGPAMLISDSFQVFALLMLNNAMGTIMGFLKYRRVWGG